MLAGLISAEFYDLSGLLRFRAPVYSAGGAATSRLDGDHPCAEILSADLPSTTMEGSPEDLKTKGNTKASPRGKRYLPPRSGAALGSALSGRTNSIPYLRRILARLFSSAAFSGDSSCNSAIKSSNPPGIKTVNALLGVSDGLRKACGIPRGTRAIAPASAMKRR